MARSIEILSLIRLLDETGWSVQDCMDYIREGAQSNPDISPGERAEGVENIHKIRAVISSLLNAKRAPQRELSDEIIQKVLEIFGDEDLDEYLTILELKGVPGIVTRWKKLRVLQVVLLPGERVTDYVRQATTCYLYGLYNAAAILCRAVLQFALEEAFQRRGGLDLSRVGRRDYIDSLIKFALNTKIISPELAGQAHKIRKIGNDSVHKANCSEAKALDAIGYTGRVLAGIYGQT